MENDRVQKHVKIVGDFLYRNLMETFLPFPVDLKYSSEWARTGGVKNGGETIIFTSHMYQMASLFKYYEKYIGLFGLTGGSKTIASLGSKLIKPQRSDMQRSEKILNNIYNILKRNGIEASYLYEKEPYSGALLYELGFREEFIEYGIKLKERFKELGVRRIITSDPHTTNALNRLKTLAGFDIPFNTYLEYMGNSRGDGNFVLHDSCLYSRFLGMYHSSREIIKKAGLSLVEDPVYTSNGTSMCCGGPMGPIDSKLSDEIGRLRAEHLKKVNENILVLCPLCYANLSPFAKVYDLAEVVS